MSGDVSLAAPERDEKLAVQAAAQATSPVVRTVAVGMDAGDYTDAALSSLLSTNPEWAPDIPLNAGGFEAYHYRKD